MLRSSRLPLLLFPLFVLSLLLTVGCQKEDGPTRYDISGKVTLNGEPVPGGSIVFTPDSQKGNGGPQGTAKIVDGRYDTADNGRGTVGGPHHVHVIATDSATGQASETEAPLAEHTFEIDIPKDSAEHDLEIPKW